jgi:polysaccharide deacetylase family protein (PEP-CTERM system associated)
MFEHSSNEATDCCKSFEMAHAHTVSGSPQLTAMSIDVEDWFHAENLQGVIGRSRWADCESRVEMNTMKMLEILDENEARATFFVLGWVAERYPQLVQTISQSGHEIASHGYDHQLVYRQKPAEFRADVQRSKALLEDLTGSPVYGYRAPSFSITDWAIDILQDLGFRYDSSLFPTVAHDRYGKLSAADVDAPISLLKANFYEVTISSLRLGNLGLPWGGGGYFRLLPFRLWCGGVRAILNAGRPYVFYIHPWEIDPEQPQLDKLDAISQFRHRVNLHRCEKRFAAFVAAFDWITLWALLCQHKHSGSSARAKVPPAWDRTQKARRLSL